MSAGEKLSNRISSGMYKTNQNYFPEALITKMKCQHSSRNMVHAYHCKTDH